MLEELEELEEHNMSFPMNLGGMPIVTASEMYRAEESAARAGVSKLELMENACQSIVSEITSRWTPRKTLVLCGPGQNGGDGLGVACLLQQRRWIIDVVRCFPDKGFEGNAQIMSERWGGPWMDEESVRLEDYALVVDAVLGIGLKRELEPRLSSFFEKINALNIDVVAVDIPTGISSGTGDVLGGSLHANLTVTFGWPKPGHFLLPGKDICGQIVVSDIGVTEENLTLEARAIRVNGPNLWLDKIPRIKPEAHKYHRGHSVIIGGGSTNSTGAARLAAEASLRSGSGLATLWVPSDALADYSSAPAAILLEGRAELPQMSEFLADDRKNVVLIGPGCGVSEETRILTKKILSSSKKVVLDADALTSFSANPTILFDLISSDTVLTPHSGEFAKLFKELSYGDKISLTRAAAKTSGAIIIYKGNDTVIAEPGGKAVVNFNAPTNLATAGTGDVLSGIVSGLLAQGCSPFAASCISVWCHSRAASYGGKGLIADDLLQKIPKVFQELEGYLSI